MANVFVNAPIVTLVATFVNALIDMLVVAFVDTFVDVFIVTLIDALVGHRMDTWDCVPVIVKAGAALRQEELAVQLIHNFEQIW
ncbi:hypothetical protein FISHEDRAFT_73353 [Fistulina hepatica ATCC 64428]|uniref:Uncharacterized protein n=1 Tax=Fistulina hepatica ATCC 64428 TaxID=1128425 RepID=A0A0D7ACY7_9AGAR|nr:hypothetical protein FISHEDRAFT_73353 [Fistulina hepatica ATCC 64428]